VSPYDPEFVDQGVRWREVVACIELAGEFVGMIQLREWELGPFVTERVFLDATDAWSQGTADFGLAVASSWSVKSLARLGGLIELEHVWIKRGTRPHRLWAAAVKALLRSRYRKSYALLILNTWPDGEKAEKAARVDWRGLTAWDQRRTSLGRLARAALGTKPLPKDAEAPDQWW